MTLLNNTKHRVNEFAVLIIFSIFPLKDYFITVERHFKCFYLKLNF